MLGSAVAGDEVKLFGIIKKIEMTSSEATYATVTVKETKSDKLKE